MSESISISIVTPTYNERENVGPLVEEIFAVLAGCDDIDAEIIIVDDNSPDGTGAAAEALTQHFPVQVIHRAGKLGLGSAVMEGWQLSTRPYVGVIDADLSHDPSILPDLIHRLRDHDLTIGSRFGAESRVEKWALHRKLISVVGVGMARVLTGAEDPLSGYFCLRRQVLAGGFRLTSSGYKILLEILMKGTFERHCSIPFIFRNRQFSDSKLNWKEHALFLKQIFVFSLQRLFRRHR